MNTKKILISAIILSSLLISTFEQRGGFKARARKISGSRMNFSFLGVTTSLETRLSVT